MNAPFKPPVLEPILADVCVSISGLKRNPSAVIEAAKAQQVAVLNRGRPVAYVIAPHVWEYLSDLVDDVRLAEQAREALEESGESIEIDLDALLQD